MSKKESQTTKPLNGAELLNLRQHAIDVAGLVSIVRELQDAMDWLISKKEEFYLEDQEYGFIVTLGSIGNHLTEVLSAVNYRCLQVVESVDAAIPAESPQVVS